MLRKERKGRTPEDRWREGSRYSWGFAADKIVSRLSEIDANMNVDEKGYGP